MLSFLPVPNLIVPHVGRRESTCGSQAAGPGRYSPGPTAAPPVVTLQYVRLCYVGDRYIRVSWG